MTRVLLIALCTVAVHGFGRAAPAGAQDSAPVSREAPGSLGGQPLVAIGELEQAVARDPGDPRPLVILGLAYWDRDDYERALATFQRAVEVGPRSAEAHNWLGVALAAKGDLPGAIAAFRRAVALDPEYGRAHTNLGSTLAQSGEFDEAVQTFEKALALEPNSVGAQLNLGLALREKGALDRALEHLQRVAAATPDNPSVQYELGQTLRQNGDLTGAVAAFDRALELAPELREGYYALGMTLKQQSAAARRPRAAASPADDLVQRARDAAARGELAPARAHLIDAIHVDAAHADAHNLLGFVLGQQGDLATALTYLERAVALRPASAESQYNLGVALWYSGRREEALAHLQESVRLDPAAGPSHAFLGTALRESGHVTEARRSLQRAIALLPPTAAVYVDLGITYLRDNRLEHALGQFEAALNLPPASRPAPDWDGATAGLREAVASGGAPPEAYNVLGRLLGRAGASSDDVAAAFREAIRLRPDYPEAHNNLGLVLIQTGDDETGIAAIREALRLSPQYADARANLGAALTPTDAEQAIAELEQAVALGPTNVNAHFNLAIAYGLSPARGVAPEIEQLRKVVELAPGFARGHLALGKALLRDGRVPEALTSLEEATRLDPASGEGHYQLGLALARAGRKAEAAAALDRGRELTAADDRRQNAGMDFADGRVALARGDLDEAVAKLRRAIRLRPDWSEAHRYLGLALEKQGDVEGAAAALRRAVELSPADPVARSSLDRLTSAPEPARGDARVAELEGYIREGRFKEVEPLLAEYVSQHPSSSWGWYALGYSQFAQQKIGDSIKSLAKSLELDLTNAEAHKILGRNLMIIGRFDAAQVEFEQAIRYKPDSADSHYNLGKLFSIQDNWEPARRAFEAALRIDPSYLEAIDALGLTLEALGDDRGAVAHYEKAIALVRARQGTFVSAHVNLSAYYNRTGDPDQALRYAREALDLDPRSDRAWFQKGRADERRGDVEAAVEALNQAIVLNARASSYYYVLAGLYRRLGWLDESRQALEAFKRLEQESAELEKRRRSAAPRESRR